MQAEARLLLPTYERYKVLFRKGAGCYLYDDEGRRYLDFVSGLGVNALGYNHPAVRGAIREQSAKLIHISNLYYHDFQAPLAERLTSISGLDRAFFCNSGTEAIEGALKLARLYARHRNTNGHRPAWRVLALEHSFHGRTFGALAATSSKKYREPFEPLLPGVRFVKHDDIADLERKLDSSVCALLLETVQGEGGVRPISSDFLTAARKLTRKSGALLIADEIQCGLGRTGKWFAFQHYGIMPDIVTIAKPLAGGLPLGAILMSNDVARAIKPGLHGTTFGGGPLACAVALAVVDTIEREGLLQHVNEIGHYLEDALLAVKREHPVVNEVRGMGVMRALEVSDPDAAKFAVSYALEQDVLINRTHDTALRLLPPFIIERKHVNVVAEVIGAALAKFEEKQGTPAAATRVVARRKTHA
jgi:acetylornithine aminotransferase/acetylornithine/N-succinyldiaminopimelate aminotransferase